MLRADAGFNRFEPCDRARPARRAPHREPGVGDCAPSPRDSPVINAILSTSGLFTGNLLTRFKQPRIGLEIIDRLQHALADAQRRPPPQSTDAAGVQEDERAVAHPPALAAAYMRRGLAPSAGRSTSASHRRCNIHRPRLKRFTGAAALDRHQHRIDAIMNVEIALTLLAISQHLDARIIRFQLPQKIENVTVRVSFAQDRDEAKDVSAEAKPEQWR